MTDRSKPEIRNLSDAAPGLLCKAGIETAITVDHPEIPLRLLPMALMLAVRAGMDKTDALRAVTSVPAKIAGMQDRIGQPENRSGCRLCAVERGSAGYCNPGAGCFCKRHTGI